MNEEKILKSIKDFKEGYATIVDIIKSIEIDLIDKDIEDLKIFIEDYKN